jgi:hypothetical protein
VTYLYVPGTLDGFVADLLEQKAAMVAKVEAASAAQSSLIETIVNLAISGVDPTPSRTAEPARPTMGLLEETLGLLEQFRDTTLASLQSGVVQRTFPSSRNPRVLYTVEMINGVAVCDCPGFSYGGNCKHAREVARAGG